MTLSLSTLMPLVLQAIRSPRETARTLMSAGVPGEALPLALALVIVLSVLLTSLGGALLPEPEGGEAAALVISPLVLALLLGAFLSAYIWGIHTAGRAFGGTGSLHDAALLMIFVQFILLTGQVVEVVLWLVAPPLAGLFVIVMVAAAFWININFIDELHGFGSLLKSFVLMLLVSFGIALVALFLMSLAGVSLQG